MYAPAILPAISVSMLAAGGAPPIWSTVTVLTAFARFRRPTVVDCPVTTMPAMWSTSKDSDTAIVLLPPERMMFCVAKPKFWNRSVTSPTGA